MSKKPNPASNANRETYVVLAVCNFDDVIVGAYATLARAISRADQVFAKPEIRFNYQQPNETEFLGVRVYLVQGETSTKVYQRWFGDEQETKTA